MNWFDSGVIVAMLATGTFFLGAAIVRRWSSPNPLVNIPFLKNRNTLILATGLFSFRFVLLAVALLIPSFLGVTQGYRPLETGQVVLWVAGPQLLVGLVTAWLMRRLDGRLIMAVGFATVAVACLMNAQLTSAWIGDNFWSSQLVISVGLSITFVSLVGMFIQQGAQSGALLRPMDILTYSSFIHMVRLFGGEVGTATLQRFISLREKFHSNLIGLHIDASSWLSDERLRMLSGGVAANSSGADEAQKRALVIVSGQVSNQAYTLAYMDGFILVACLCAAMMILIALLKPMGTLFDSSSKDPPGK